MVAGLAARKGEGGLLNGPAARMREGEGGWLPVAEGVGMEAASVESE